MSDRPLSDRRTPSVLAQLVKYGFSSATTAETRLRDPRLARLLGVAHDAHGAIDANGLASSALPNLREAADPDLALLGLLRLGEVLDQQTAATLRESLPTPAGRRLLVVLGASGALADHLVRHPTDLDCLSGGDKSLAVSGDAIRADVLAAIGCDPSAEIPCADGGSEADLVAALRRAYRRRVLAIAGVDLASAEPTTILPEVAAALADAAGAALEGALAIARGQLDHPGAREVRLAVIAMGKCGARELNYVSDVDVVFVVEPCDGLSEAESIDVGAKLAASLMRYCAAPGQEPALWQVDPALRPEGKNGPLVRTLSSHVRYYQSWAKTWEFQALLKARPIAGDMELGARYVAALNPLVWTAVERENFVADSQAMRRRVEDLIPAAESERQLKLGAGGLRDVEFTVQLLQLVHGRADATLQLRSTLDAISALSNGGYIGRLDAARLADCYRFLRVIEHRLQLRNMRRTHLLPTGERELVSIARAAGLRGDDSRALPTICRSVRLSVRRLHEELYYRPLLPATAQLTVDDMQLLPVVAERRLAALGYRNPAGARRHLDVLAEGLSRRAAIQRQLLPVMLGWFAGGADPDGALLAFRRLSEDLGRTHWYLKMLRDSANAARRLAEALSASRYVADVLDSSREAVAWFGDDAKLTPKSLPVLEAQLGSALSRQESTSDATITIRSLRRREMLRVAMADVLGMVELETVLEALTDISDVVLEAGFSVAAEAVRTDLGLDELPTQLVVLAMGRLGGRELGYSSDADVILLHQPKPGADPEFADVVALRVVTEARALLEDAGPEPGMELDMGLRPEGRSGPVVRTVESYQGYLLRWAKPWEFQALLRARVLAPEGLRSQLTAIIDTFRYPEGGISLGALREIRRIKARMDSERLPRGADPTRHLKLGRGGLTDIEWTVQLLQLRHGAAVAGLRVTSTLGALAAAQEAGIASADDVEVLTVGWRETVRLRNAVVLAGGRTSAGSANQIPHDSRQLDAVARLLGYPPGSGEALLEDHLRRARHTSEVVNRLFLG